MALPKDQQDVVDSIAALCGADSREAIAAELVRNEALRGGFLRQADYDRRMNQQKAEFDKKNGELQESIGKYNQAYRDNETWFKKNEPAVAYYQNERPGLEQKVQDLEKQIQEATGRQNSGGEGDVKQEDVQKIVDEKLKALGAAPTQEALSKIINEAVTTAAAAERQNFIDQTLPLQTAFAMDMAEIAIDHKQEFSQALNREEFSKFCQERGHKDPKKAYEDFVKPQRDKKDMDKQVAEAVAAKEKEMREQYTNTSGVPGSGAVPGSGEMGIVQKSVTDRQSAAAAPAAGAGAASAAAAAWRQEHSA